MTLDTNWLRFGNEGVFSGYWAAPMTQVSLPGIIVIQEAWGVDRHIEDITCRLAQSGYAVLAPDLYARDGHRPAALHRERVADYVAFLNSLPSGTQSDPKARAEALQQLAATERARLAETQDAVFNNVRNEVHLTVLRAAATFLQTQCTEAQNIGVIGFCMGGHWSLRLAAHEARIAAAISLYGAPPLAEDVPNLNCPVLGLYGGSDVRINDQLPHFAQLMQQHGRAFTQHTYAGAGHAFFNDTRPSYDVAASRDAIIRILTFFQSHLVGA